MDIRQAPISSFTDAKEAEFLRLVKANYGCIIWVLNRFNPIDPVDEGDYLQEMYLYAWKRFEVYRPHEEYGFGTWLTKTCLWAIYRLRQKKDRHFKFTVYPEAMPDGAAGVVADIADDVSSLHLAIRRLPSLARNIVQLHLDGYELIEIAELLGLSQSAVFHKFDRIKKKIRQQRNLYFAGINMTEEKKAIGLPNYNKRNQNNKLSRQVFQYNKEGKLINTWPSVNEVIRNGFKGADRVILGKPKAKTSKGYVFSYTKLTPEQCAERYTVKKKSNQFIIIQYSHSGEFIRRYESQQELKDAGFHPGNAWSCAKGKRPMHKGYKWAFPI